MKSSSQTNNYSIFKIFYALIMLGSISLFAQDISEEFLDSLPEGLRDQVEAQSEKSEEEQELEALFRADTSIYNNKRILENIKSQVKDLEEKVLYDENTKKELERFGEDFFSSIQSSFMPINVPNLNSDYILDVGDELSVLLTGIKNQELELFVQRDGSLVIPEFGKVSVAGNTLANAAKIIKLFIEGSEIGTSAFVTLKKIRDVQILLLGGVNSPGVYTISGGSNALFALNAAGGISERGSFRKIDHRRNGEIIQSIDLYDIFVFGKYDVKHQVRSGDVIFVHPPQIQIPISGGIYNPSVYEMKQSQSLNDLVTYAGGFKEGFYGFDSISVKRTSIDKASTIDISINDIAEFKLMHRDIVNVPFYDNEFSKIKSVTVEGMVNKPGKYFIDDGETLSSVVKRAGGYKEKAYIFGGMLLREDALEKEQLYAEVVYSDTINFLVSSIAKPGISFDSSAVQLLIEELKSQKFTGRVITEFDLDQLSENYSEDMILQNNDQIIIPQIQKVVYLFGDLNAPTILNYQPDFRMKDYIKLAGGIKESATQDILVINPNGISQQINGSFSIFNKNQTDIYPGSIIYVPRDIGQLSGIHYASTVAPVLSSLAISLASLNSINN
ncbi:SLBB domain-containing protein [Gammaproteobacteria bacterium]|nr:SLBB domain-containing protein [Gammaproteobacteria bacterium]